MKNFTETMKTLGPMVNGENIAKMLSFTTYAGDPTNNVVPEFVGQECQDTSGNHWYRAHGLAAADWKKLNN